MTESREYRLTVEASESDHEIFIHSMNKVISEARDAGVRIALEKIETETYDTEFKPAGES